MADSEYAHSLFALMTILWLLFSRGLAVTALDIDNALYMTSAIEDFEPKEQQRAIVLGLIIEFIGRVALIYVILSVFGGRDAEIKIFGLTIPVESIALIGAGIFLFWRSIRELIDFFRGEQDSGETSITIDQTASFPRRFVEMSIISLTLSIDTIIAVSSATSEAWQIVYLLAFSAIMRALFVRQIAAIIHRFPSLNIIILTFLSMIGLELVLQGFGLSFPEEEFNLILMLAVVAAVIYEGRRGGFTRFLEKFSRNQERM